MKRLSFMSIFVSILCLLSIRPLFAQAMKPTHSDGIQFVTATGSDSNDGLSWGTAKSTLEGAQASLPNGGIIEMGAGTFNLSTSLEFTAPVAIHCTPRTVIKYTRKTGAAIILAYGGPAQGGMSPGLYGCRINGPGTSTPTVAIQMGEGSDTARGIVGTTIDGVMIGVEGNPGTGFGTGIKFLSNLDSYLNQIINPGIYSTRVGIDFAGENNSVFGGVIAGNSTGIKFDVGTEDGGLYGTSLDDNTAYDIDCEGPSADISLHGVHMEDAGKLGFADEIYIAAGCRVSMFGGALMDNRTSGIQNQLVKVNNGAAFSALGTTVWSGGINVLTVVNYATTSANIAPGFLYFYRTSGNISAYYSSTGSNTAIVFQKPLGPNSNGFGNGAGLAAFGSYCIQMSNGKTPNTFATICPPQLSTAVHYTLPTFSGKLALVGENGVSAGKIDLSSGEGSHTFSRPYAVVPVCTASDETRVMPVRVKSSRIEVSIAGAGNDAVAWICTPAAN